MTEDEHIEIRLQCLHMACHVSGEDVEYDYVLEAAQKYESFVFGKKVELKIVRGELE